MNDSDVRCPICGDKPKVKFFAESKSRTEFGRLVSTSPTGAGTVTFRCSSCGHEVVAHYTGEAPDGTVHAVLCLVSEEFMSAKELNWAFRSMVPKCIDSKVVGQIQ